MVKLALTFSLALVVLTSCSQQQQHFDLANYSAPKGSGWTKSTTENAVQFSKEDAAKGEYCLISLYKSVPGTGTSKQNFDAAWASLVQQPLGVTAAPEMQTPSSEDGWEAQNGYAPFEHDGKKGVALLVTSTGYNTMVNILVLMNTTAYEQELSGFLEAISFKKPAGQSKTAAPNNSDNNNNKTIASSGFSFTTTNFDDGWTSAEKPDWVEVTKGNIKVLLHYPKQGTIFPADPVPLTNAAWDILVSPRYSNLKGYRPTYINSYDRVYMSMGTATENETGKSVYIVFFRRGDTGWLEFVSPDKNSFMQVYRFDPETIRWDSDFNLVNPLSSMVSYNKFAIAEGDFKGTWTNDFTGVQQLYNIYTGNNAGMNIHQSNQNFEFRSGSTYNWDIMVVNGQVGNSKYAHVKSSGRFKVLNNWQIQFSDIEGKPKTYNAFFSSIKGARLLKLLDAEHSGNGVPIVFGMK